MSKAKKSAIVNVLIGSLKLQFEKLENVNRKIDELEAELQLNGEELREKNE